MRVTLEWLSRVSQGRLLGGSPKQTVTGLCIDSRKVAAGDCFVALPGNRVDGHSFIAQAQAAGAVVCLCQRAVPGVPCIQVADPRKALGQIGAAYRRLFPKLQVVGITGSSGKTTTKEMVNAVLGAKHRVHSNLGNLNNDLGVPLTLARLEKNHTAAVIEMGMNHAGEIRYLTQLAAPQVGLITNIGDAHLGNFKDRKALARAKAELLAGLPKTGMAVINLDDPNLATRARNRRITFGLNALADVRIVQAGMRAKGTHVVLAYKGKNYAVQLKAYGVHQAWNAAAAVAVGLAFRVTPAQACKALAAYRPQAGMRSQLLKLGPHQVLVDAYNSNPQSAAAALRLAAELPVTGKRILVAGSMLELGAYSREAHEQLGREVAVAGIQSLITVGEEARAIRTGAPAIRPYVHVRTAADVIGKLKPWLSTGGDLIVVKGSRGIGLEKVVDDLKQRFKV